MELVLTALLCKSGPPVQCSAIHTNSRKTLQAVLYKFTKLTIVELFCCLIPFKFKHHWKQKLANTKINVPIQE